MHLSNMTQIKIQLSSTLSFSKLSYNRKQIRSRLLKRDGCYRRARPLPLCRRKDNSKASSACNNARFNYRGVSGRVNVTFEPMKCSSQKANNPTRRIWQKSSIVQFHKEVSVLQIKSFRDYAKGTLDRLYSTRQEIKENARRNKLEFQAEGGDWRNVVEEDGMLIDENGKFFHPVHALGVSAFRKKRFVSRRQRSSNSLLNDSNIMR